MTVATYTLGPAIRPSIHHDNGFLDRFAKRQPTRDDYRRLRGWELKLGAVEAIQGVPFAPLNDLPDALAAYRHFLHGKGQDRTFSYERYVKHDPSGLTTLENVLLDAKQGAEKLYALQFSAAPTASFQMTSSAIPAGSQGKYDPHFPYPATENWQKALGSHMLWTSADVAVKQEAGGPLFVMAMTLHAEDRYNFNPGAQDIATGIPDADNGVFEVTGLAMQYMNYSTLTRKVTWQGSTMAPGSVDGAPGNRQRQPGDNRRLRSRL